MEKIDTEKTILFSDEDSQICIFHHFVPSENLLSRLTPTENLGKDIQLLGNEARTVEYLATRIALKDCLKGVEKEVIYNVVGKPFLKDDSAYISLSHTKHWAAAIANPQYEVGIDIERLNRKYARLYKKYLNSEEQHNFFNPNDHRKLAITWSGKEALYKIIGKPAINFKEQLHITNFNLNETGIGDLYATHTPTGQKYRLKYHINEECVLVYCVDKNREK